MSKRSWRVIGLALLSAVAGCDAGSAMSAHDGGPPDSLGRDALDPPDIFPQLDGPNSATCAPHPTDPIPMGGTCSATVTHCEAVGDDCLGAGLRAVLETTLAACHIDCGDVWVGFSGGCATTLIVQVRLDQTQAACLKDVLFEARFDCVPTDGWKRLSLGSCTIP